MTSIPNQTNVSNSFITGMQLQRAEVKQFLQKQAQPAQPQQTQSGQTTPNFNSFSLVSAYGDAQLYTPQQQQKAQEKEQLTEKAAKKLGDLVKSKGAFKAVPYQKAGETIGANKKDSTNKTDAKETPKPFITFGALGLATEEAIRGSEEEQQQQQQENTD